MNVFASGFAFAIQTIGAIILARLLRPIDFGLVTMVLTVSLLLQNFGVNGFTEAVIQAEQIDHKQVSTLFWINVSVSTMIAILFIALAPAIVWFYKEPRLQPIIVAISSSIVLAGLSVQHFALLKRGMEFRKIAVIEMTAVIISTGIPITLAWWGWGYWALVTKWVISPLVLTVGAWVMCGWRPGLPARRAGVGPLVRFALHTYGNFIMGYFRRNVDKMLIGRFYGSQPLGLYDRAYHLSSVLPGQIVSPLNSVALSAFSRLSGDPTNYRYNYLRVLSVIAFVGMPLSLALTLISNDVVLLLLGPQWKEAGKIFFAFGLSIGVTMIYITHGWLHLSLGTPDRWFRWGVVELIVTALCFVIGLLFGALGVAVAYSASFYILIGPALWYAGKPIHLKFSSVVSTVWRYYVSALVAGLLCWFILYKIDLISSIFVELNIFIRIGLSLVVCLSIYLLLVLVFHQSSEPISQFISVVKEMVPKISGRNVLKVKD